MSFGDKSRGDPIESAWANVVEAALGDGDPVQGASYIIFKDGSDYKARNGTTGVIDYDETDAATVIQAAIDALTSGGKILIKQETYSLSTTLSLKYSSLMLEGEGKGTVLKLANGADVDILDTVTDSTLNFVKIANLKLDGNRDNNASGKGINWHGVQQSTIESVYIEYMSEEAIYLRGTATYKTIAPRIFDCYIHSCDSDGISGASYSSDGYFYGNDIGSLTGEGIVLSSHSGATVNNNKVWSCSRGIDVYRSDHCHVVGGNIVTASQEHGIYILDSSDCLVVGNTSKDNSQGAGDHDGIVISGSAGNPCYDNIIAFNRCLDTQGSKTQRRGITEQATSDYNIISHNSVRGNVNADGITTVGGNTQVEDNIGDL